LLALHGRTYADASRTFNQADKGCHNDSMREMTATVHMKQAAYDQL
jgi:hypothetical protein